MKFKIGALILTGIFFCQCEKNLNPEYSEFTDSRDNYPYTTVKIGDQTWFAENLKYLPIISSMDSVSSTEIQYFVYGYTGNNIAEAKLSTVYLTFGALYNRPAALEACPPGWRLPEEEDWEKLRRTAGANNGGALKSANYWAEGKEGSNSSGFSLLPRGPGESECWLWSKGKPRDDSERVYLWGFPFSDDKLEHDDHDGNAIGAIRCIKN